MYLGQICWCANDCTSKSTQGPSPGFWATLGGMEVAVSALHSRSLEGNGVNPASSNLAAAKAALLRFGAFAPSVHVERVRKVLQIIESTSPRSIRDLAVEFKLSHSRLEHWFKEQTGVCLGHLLTEQRLRRAADLLEHSYMSVKEVACAVGYQHASSFVRAFEHCFAQSPGCYRRQYWSQQADANPSRPKLRAG